MKLFLIIFCLLTVLPLQARGSSGSGLVERYGDRIRLPIMNSSRVVAARIKDSRITDVEGVFCGNVPWVKDEHLVKILKFDQQKGRKVLLRLADLAGLGLFVGKCFFEGVHAVKDCNISSKEVALLKEFGKNTGLFALDQLVRQETHQRVASLLHPMQIFHTHDKDGVDVQKESSRFYDTVFKRLLKISKDDPKLAGEVAEYDSVPWGSFMIRFKVDGQTCYGLVNLGADSPLQTIFEVGVISNDE